MSDTTFIYTLEFPEGNIRYVGKSNNPQQRFNSHLKESERNITSHKISWIKSVLRSNNKPILNILDIVPSNDWQIYEQYWISQFITWGFNLVNSTIGGDGNHKISKEIRDKIAETLRGRKIPENVLEKRSKALKGKIRSKEVRQRISDTLMNHSVSDAQRMKQSETMKRRCENGEIVSWIKGKTGFTSPRKGIKLRRDEIVGRDKRIKKVYQYTLNNEFIREWEYAKDIETLGIIPNLGRMGVFNCCRGNSKQAFGFIWKFNND